MGNLKTVSLSVWKKDILAQGVERPHGPFGCIQMLREFLTIEGEDANRILINETAPKCQLLNVKRINRSRQAGCITSKRYSIFLLVGIVYANSVP